MSSASPAPAILIHVLRAARPEEEEICREAENHCRKLKPTSRIYNNSSYKSYCSDESGPQQTNAWFIIRDTSSGLKISEIFRGLPQDDPIHSRKGTNCVFVGFDLYDIGGRGSTLLTMRHASNKIRRLDTKNPHHGWNSETLPFYSEHGLTAVSGKFIYFFPDRPWFTDAKIRPDPEAPPPWAYMYDTINKNTYKVKHPHNQLAPQPVFCAPLDGCRVLVPVEAPKSVDVDLYIHKPDQRKWELVQHVDSPFSAKEWDSYRDIEAPLSDFRGRPHAISAGVYYGLSGHYLHVYNIRPWKFYGYVLVPKFDNPYTHKVSMVAVADCELCFLWHTITKNKISTLYYAKISVSLEPILTVTLKQQVQFKIDALEVVNCLPYASFSDDLIETEEGEEETQVNERHKQKVEEVDWKERCMYLEEELRRLQEQKQSYSTQTSSAATDHQLPHKVEKRSKKRSIRE